MTNLSEELAEQLRLLKDDQRDLRTRTETSLFTVLRGQSVDREIAKHSFEAVHKRIDDVERSLERGFADIRRLLTTNGSGDKHG